MTIILLSGGSGKRLWPLSNDVRSKQFIKFFRYKDSYESMIQRSYRQIKEVDPNGRIIIATSKSQVSAINNQLNGDVEICVEPHRRDTFPAIALAVSFLKDKKSFSSDDVVVVCPVDQYVDENYFKGIKNLFEIATKNKDKNLFLMGIKPTIPSEKYGYIIPATKDRVSSVIKFVEKPNEEEAAKFIDQGALWSGGVFAFRVNYVLEIAKRLFGTNSFEELSSIYDSLPCISFDYAVVENEKSIGVLRFDGAWFDAGTWATLTDIMSDNLIGNGLIDCSCRNVHIVNELDLPIVALGLQNVVVSASPDGILVSEKNASSDLKRIVDSFHREAMFAEKSWGNFKVIDASKTSLTIKVNIQAGDSMNYHSHQYRDEVWVVVSGMGKVLIDGQEKPVEVGEVIVVKAGCKHKITAITELTLIEVQIGEDITVHDKKKYSIG